MKDDRPSPSNHIATFNVKNVNANILAIQELLKMVDVLAIQEHWLFNFELACLDDLSTDFTSFARAVDDSNPISPYQKPRGYGGVALMWRKSIDNRITKLPDGNEKIICIEIIYSTAKLCLVCAYLPCRGRSTESETQFCDALDAIREIYIKYNETHTIILMGDLNASITRQIPSSRDRTFLVFCRDLSISTLVPKIDTFFHVNGKDSLQSDYILIREEFSDLITRHVTLGYEDLTSNVSDHVPVLAELSSDSLQYIRETASSTKPKDVPVHPRLDWLKMDIVKYRSMTESSSFHGNIDGAFDLSFAIQMLNDGLLSASKECYLIPVRKAKRSKKGLDIWNPRISTCVKINKACFVEWKHAGSPRNSDHPALVERKRAKSMLRSEIRRTRAETRERMYTEIMNAKTEDTRLFYRLVQKQRSTKSSNTDMLLINGQKLVDDEAILEGFKNHFELLATPKANSNFNDNFKLSSQFNEALLDIRYREYEHERVIPLCMTEVKQLINSCKNGKAQDADQLTAEHFKYAGSGILADLTDIINYMLQSRSIPDNLLHGTLTPVLKKHKDKTDPNNYRGITVCSMLVKLLEKAWLLRTNPIITSNQSKLQRGFTAGCSSSNAALLITESIAEAYDTKKDLYITFLDASKAFDVVDHAILMDELYHMGIKGDLWLTLKQLYKEPITSVKWNGLNSKPFPVRQGVRQGGVSSAPIYKTYTNPLLEQLEQHHQGHRIGSISIPAPTCADDMAVISHNHTDSQTALDIVSYYTDDHRGQINASKSATIAYNTDVKPQLMMNSNEIPYPESSTHLGIARSSSNAVNIDERIQLARRATYALMGAGMHGKNGLSPCISHHIWYIYVVPRMIYGLDVVSLKASDLTKLEVFQRKILRQLQFLPEKPAPANSAVYGLLGARPITAVVHNSILTHLGNIFRSENTLEKQLAIRQLAVKNRKSKSWFVMAKLLLEKYDLPSIYDVLDEPPEKTAWKNLVSDAINSYWNEELRKDATNKTSLKYLNTENLEIGSPHPVWYTLSVDPREIEMAAVKARLLTGTYLLQANRAKFNQFEVDPTCIACRKEPEDRLHFILRCNSLCDSRRYHLTAVVNILQVNLDHNVATAICDDESALLQVILDCTHPALIERTGGHSILASLSDCIEPISRKLCYGLHIKRSTILATLNHD